MQVAGFIMGILSVVGLLLGLLPLLEWVQWLVIPFAGIGLIISIVGVAISKRGGIGVAGIIFMFNRFIYCILLVFSS